MGCIICGKKIKARSLCVNHYAKYRRGSLAIDAPLSRALTDDDREVKYVNKVPGDCWLWTGATDKKGYGRVGKGAAHRWMYERKVGPIPDGMDIDHVCHNESIECDGGIDCIHRRCVNPDHLRPVTRKANLNAGNGRGGAKYVRRTTCIRGHDISSDSSVYMFSNASGGISRRCKICAKICADKRKVSKGIRHG